VQRSDDDDDASAGAEPPPQAQVPDSEAGHNALSDTSLVPLSMSSPHKKLARHEPLGTRGPTKTDAFFIDDDEAAMHVDRLE
jgi:hypothetical protein